MKTTMRMKDLKASDGFPADIDRTKKVAVIVRNGMPTTAYTSKLGEILIASSPQKINFADGIYFIYQ